MPIVIDLEAKLHYLYDVHPEIHSHKELADHLNINPANINIWIKGQAGVRPPNMIPKRHLPKLLKLFMLSLIDKDIFCTQTLNQLAEILEQAIKHTWDDVLTQPIKQSSIAMTRVAH